MKPLVALLVLLVVASVAQAETIVDIEACLGGPTVGLPAEPPVATGAFQSVAVELWRTQCVDQPGVYVPVFRLSGIGGCQTIIVNEVTRAVCDGTAHLLLTPSNSVPAVFSTPGKAAVSLSLNGDIVAGLPALSAVRVTLVSDGCSPCASGNRVRVRALATNSSSVPIEVDVRSVLLAPGGFELLLPPGDLVVLAPGTNALLLLDQEIPDSAPNGSYFFEVGLLTPVTGVTVGRARLRIDLI